MTIIPQDEATRFHESVALPRAHRQQDEVNMRLYFFTTDTGCFEYLFTTDEQQAIQTFAIYMVLAKVSVSKMWFTEVTPASVSCELREHLREALSQGVEAFGFYQAGKGWDLRLVQDRFDELSRPSEGGVR